MSKNRLGGSALTTVFSQIGDETADMEDPLELKRLFNLVQILVEEGIIIAGHDRSDGGTIVTLLEMAFGGNCGIDAVLPHNDDIMGALFGEELGMFEFIYIHTYEHILDKSKFPTQERLLK